MIQSNQSEDIDIKMPFYAVTLTAEQAKAVEFHTMEFYSINGKTFFEVKGPDGKPTGEWAFYVVFKP